LPGAFRHEAQPAGPFHCHQCPQRQGLLLLLDEQLIGRGRQFEAVQVEVHQRRGGRSPVVLRQGEGGAGHRLIEAQTLGQPLHDAGLAGTQIALQEQHRPRPRRQRQPLSGQRPAQGGGGGRIGQKHVG